MPEDWVFECFLLIALIKYLVMHFLCYKVSGIGIVICSHCFRNVDFISILVYRRNGSFLQVFYIWGVADLLQESHWRWAGVWSETE